MATMCHEQFQKIYRKGGFEKMRKSMKKVAATLMAATMVLGTMTTVFAIDGDGNFEATDVEDSVKYTIAGGCSPVAWAPASASNELTEVMDGIYSIQIDLPAFNADEEWNSRFKICKIDDVTVESPWSGALCLGTQTYDDNQTMFRAENEEAIPGATVYFDVNTGAVAIMKDGEDIEYKFSWVGYDNEVQYTTVAEFDTCGYTWPADKVKTDVPSDLVASHNKLVAKIKGTDLSDESLYENEGVKYTVAGGCAPYGWSPLSSVNEMKEVVDGIYAINMSFPAYDESAEWNNRFKICKLDDVTCAAGWTGSICLGTTVADDNQTTFRVECAEAIEDATVYYDSKTGAVAVMKDGNDIEYKFSWVGYDNEVQYTTVADFATCGYTWPADKVKTDAPADMAATHAALVAKINGNDLGDDSLYENGEVRYTVAGGCAPYGWNPLSSINELKESETLKGVYTIDMHLPAWNPDAEWNNRFKILKLDDITCAAGWTGNMCMGTDIWDDNQTVIRVENPEEVDVTVYYYPATNSVVLMDKNGNEVPYTFSWVGYDNEVQYTTVDGFASCGYTWPADKVKTDAPADLKDKYDALVKLIKEGPSTDDQKTDDQKKDDQKTDGKKDDKKDDTAKAAEGATKNNQSAKTGDAAPIAMLVVLMASVAVVSVIAKKKEA